MTPDKQDDREPRQTMRTRLIHGSSRSTRWEYDHHVVPPITASATFRLDSAARGAQGFRLFAHSDKDDPSRPPIYIYDRLDEPTRGMLEENLACAEGGDFALAFASGMAAISATLATLLTSGDHLITHKALYGCTYSLITQWLARIRIDASLIHMTDLDQLRSTFRDETRVVYFETPVNPDLTLIDIAGVRQVVNEANQRRDETDHIRMVVDNTFATHYCQRPLELGADVVCVSLTKGIGGFGTDIGGAVIGPRWLHDPLILYRKDWGGTLSPKAAWNALVYGLPSLATRMVNYQKSAHHIAKFLRDHPAVQELRYPGLECFPQFELAKKQMRDEHGRFAPGSMIHFVVRDAPGHAPGTAGTKLVDWIAQHAYCITLAVSLGQIKTLIECPYSMTHAAMPEEAKQELGLVPGGCRLSIGLEDRHDIIADLSDALDQL